MGVHVDCGLHGVKTSHTDGPTDKAIIGIGWFPMPGVTALTSYLNNLEKRKKPRKKPTFF